MALAMAGFAEVPQESYRWVEERLMRSRDNLTDVGRSMMDTAIDTYRHLRDGSLTRAARRIVRGVRSIAHPDSIIDLNSIREIQSCQGVIQRYIMANPVIRKLHERQLCDGFSDTYIERDPGMHDIELETYCAVTNGVFCEDPHNPGEYWIPQHFSSEAEHERVLDVEEQATILDIWEIVEQAARNKIDATDIMNGEIGEA